MLRMLRWATTAGPDASAQALQTDYDCTISAARRR